MVIELKYAENGKPDDRCAQALHQVEEKQYAAKLESDGIKRMVRLYQSMKGGEKNETTECEKKCECVETAAGGCAGGSAAAVCICAAGAGSR